MEELEIVFDKQSPQCKNQDINIKIENYINKDLLYKFIIGHNGKWNILKDFSKEIFAVWSPKTDGIYTVMIQAVEENDSKAFSYMDKTDYIIGKLEKNLIKNLILDKKEVNVNEKISATAHSIVSDVVFRYKIKYGDEYIILKNYTTDNTVSWRPQKIGKQELIVECKRPSSKQEADSTKKVEYNVRPVDKVEIIDFKCLSDEMFVNREIMFKVDAMNNDNKMILYKFLKINSEGEAQCLQDYSNKRIISYVENEDGNFKLLCMVKDMYSKREFDDRAVIFYNIKKYKDIEVKSFAADVTSPQLVNTQINLRAIVTGGKKILYRYLIDGNYSEDSGYSYNKDYVWKAKMPGIYKLKLMAKDESFEGDFEAYAEMNFIIEEIKKIPVKIKKIIQSKNENILKGEKINIDVEAEGGISLIYSFLVKREESVIKRVDYETSNIIDFVPEVSGDYKIEVNVKDKYSKKEFDCHSEITIQVLDYIPAKINHIFPKVKDYYMVGEKINVNVITMNTKNTLVKYVIKLNGRKVEQIDFGLEKSYEIVPKCAGDYEVIIYSLNKDSSDKFDDKRIIKLRVRDAKPITEMTIKCDRELPKINEAVTFNVDCTGGKCVIYEFYIRRGSEWKLVQKYSRKSFYTFMPFEKGNYEILVFCKSQFYSEKSYEAYSIFEMKV
ncbi:triple tyrosine motif-containing protein [Clostridium hydrogenum]|uniref:triple tyrosine motif-containing protein n=1 Tax=Clostridium hydrogenum TaxID=2855764 RepID=UPI001F4133A9|nr:triple tyrosine motif-containing protein [Clostridium hydrogenum]